MTPPTGSVPLGQDPTSAFATPPGPPLGRDVPPPGYAPQPVHPVHPVHPVAAAPAAAVPGAVPITPRDDDQRRRKAPLAWLPWALLAALLGLLALMLLAGAVAGTDGARRTGSAAASAAGGASGPSADGGAAAGAVSGAGALTAGDVDLLSSPQSLGRLGSLPGQPAVGRGVVVESVVADEGFWVGSSTAQRAFVFLTPEARQSAGESGYQVRKGQRVDLAGSVTATSEGDAARFGVTDAEGARQLTQQRAYVRATEVRLTAS